MKLESSNVRSQVTPADYEPKGFKPCDFEKFVYKDGQVKIDVGKVHSVWHEMQINACVAKSMLKTFDEYNTIDETFESEQQAQELSGSDKTLGEASENQRKVKIMKHKMDQTADFINKYDLNNSRELENEEDNEDQDQEVTGTRAILKKISELAVSNKQSLYFFFSSSL